MILPYDQFLANKAFIVPASGIDADPASLHPSLFPFQRDLTRWALRKGRSAIFATTGMGKTRMLLDWSRLNGERTLIISPLAVAQQTIREAMKMEMDVYYAKDQSQARELTITNYERADRFDASQFGAVVLDESGILKSHTGKTRNALIEQWATTPYRLCCTATPAPNDIAEMANHAEFLGVMSRVEMLANFFVHDMDGKGGEGEGWRLKGHAREHFWRWLASWGMSLLRPSDIGHDDTGYGLPPLSITPVIVPTDYVPPGMLFAVALKGVSDRARVRKHTLADRVARTVELLSLHPDGPWILWCGLNDEADALTKAIPGAVNVEGKQTPEYKADTLMGFARGDFRVLVTKPGLAGFGMNFQHCSKMAFVGLGDSYEEYFQCIRRCWRYGQTNDVVAYVVLSEPEEVIYQNVLRKERDALRMAEELVKHVVEYERAELGQARQSVSYMPEIEMTLPAWMGSL